MSAAPPMKVMRVITRLNVGGPAQHAIFLTSGLNSRRFRTTLIAGKTDAGEGDMSFLADRYGVNATDLPILGNGRGPVADIRALVSLYRIMRRESPDIVHLHLLKARLLGGMAAKLAGVPMIVETFHGNLFRGYYSRVMTWLLLKAERLIARGVMHRVVALSEGQKQELMEYGICPPSKIRVIPLGLDLRRFAESSRLAGELRTELGVPPHTILLGAIGRLVPIKGLTYLLSAVDRLRRSSKTDFRLLIVGDGPLRATLERQVSDLGLQDKVRFLGWRFDLERVYADLDIVVLSSLNEGTPVCLLEAMAAGKAVVATEVGGVPELVDDGRTGLLVAPRNVEAMVQAIARYAADPDLRRRTGERGRESVYSRYDVSTLVANTTNFYLELVAEDGRRS